MFINIPNLQPPHDFIQALINLLPPKYVKRFFVPVQYASNQDLFFQLRHLELMSLHPDLNKCLKLNVILS